VLQQIIVGLNIFKRNKVPIEIKLLALALFLQGMGVRRISRIINRSKTAIHYWTLKFREALNYKMEKKERRCIAIDESKIRVNNNTVFYLCCCRC